MRKRKIISIYISEISYKDSLNRIIELARQKKSSYVCIANVHMLVEANKDKEFANVVNNADLVTADGMPIVKSMKSLYGIKQDRIAGMDLLPDIMKASEKNQLSVFFYGSTTEVLNLIKNKIGTDFPHLITAGFYSPPFRDITEKEENDIINLIGKSKANIVFVGLGCPKQEKWMAKMKGKINSAMIGVGGAFQVYSELQKRAPKWMQKNGLEWLFRFFQDPKRLWKRYLTTNTSFIYLFLKHKLFVFPPLHNKCQKDEEEKSHNK